MREIAALAGIKPTNIAGETKPKTNISQRVNVAPLPATVSACRFVPQDLVLHPAGNGIRPVAREKNVG